MAFFICILSTFKSQFKQSYTMKIAFFISLFTLTFSALSQTYWQQEVNYKINVKLDDLNHTLSAFETFEYINHSPDQLDRLYIHLWPNAY